MCATNVVPKQKYKLKSSCRRKKNQQQHENYRSVNYLRTKTVKLIQRKSRNQSGSVFQIQESIASYNDYVYVCMHVTCT